MDDAVARARAPIRIPPLNLALFLATIATTLVIPLASTGGGVTGPRLVHEGIPFSLSLVGILLSHEMGHFLTGRAYGVDATWPFFIPAPIGIGTFGAVIRMRSAMPSRRAVLDIGAAGPIAGFLVAVPLYAWGLAHSDVRPLDPALLTGSGISSPLALVRGFAHLVERYGSILLAWQHRGELPAPVQLYGDSLITWILQRLAVGSVPLGQEVVFHPMAYAAWFGLVVTSLNLVPFGQLDGGHVTYALLGTRGAALISRALSWGLLVSGIVFSWTWIVWWALTRFVVGPRHPPALSEEPLGPGRRVLALASLCLFALTFIPVPISM